MYNKEYIRKVGEFTATWQDRVETLSRRTFQGVFVAIPRFETRQVFFFDLNFESGVFPLPKTNKESDVSNSETCVVRENLFYFILSSATTIRKLRRGLGSSPLPHPELTRLLRTVRLLQSYCACVCVCARMFRTCAVLAVNTTSRLSAPPPEQESPVCPVRLVRHIDRVRDWAPRLRPRNLVHTQETPPPQDGAR